MTIKSYREIVERLEARNKPQIDVAALREFMTANYQTMTIGKIGERFGLKAEEIKRYAKKFRLMKYERDPRSKPPPLQRGERVVKTGVIASKKNITIHTMF